MGNAAMARRIASGPVGRHTPHRRVSSMPRLSIPSLTAAYTSAIPRRDAPEFCKAFRPQEGAGNAGRPMRPIAACAMVVVERTRVSQVTPESPGIPRAMVLRLITRSPRGPGFLAPVIGGVASANLMPASGHQDHTTSPSASRAIRQERIRVHRIPPRVRDDREPPLCGTGRLRI